MLRLRIFRSCFHTSFRSLNNALPSTPRLTSLTSPSETSLARAWLTSFKATQIPRSAVELSFSRSSGPGGQNVNKVNTKATIRCPLNSSWIPPWATNYLLKSASYVPSTKSILVTSTRFRSQTENVEDCLQKLHDLIVKASSEPIQNEPSEEQKKRVSLLDKAEKRRNRMDKEMRGAVKLGRTKGRGPGWDD